MSEQMRTHLRQLQEMDTRLAEAKQAVRDFDPLFEEVEEPALVLEGALNTTRSRLQEMKLEERRLELSVDEKGERAKRLEERLGSVRNLREEAAVSTELDMVNRALKSDEQEALTLLDQIRKLEERLAEVEEAYSEAQEVVGPARDELIAKRDGAKSELAALESDRAAFVQAMDAQELRLYEGIRKGGSRAAVAELTDDGACGNCFGIVPLQSQNEVRHGTALIRCEGCGVILAAPDPNAPEPEPEAVASPPEAEAEDIAGDDEAETSDDETGDDEVEPVEDQGGPDDGEETAGEVSAGG